MEALEIEQQELLTMPESQLIETVVGLHYTTSIRELLTTPSEGSVKVLVDVPRALISRWY